MNKLSFLLQILPVWLYRRPSQRLFVIGVYADQPLLAELAQHVLLGLDPVAGSISDHSLRVGDKQYPPPRRGVSNWTLQRFLARLVRSHARYAVVALTSQGLATDRYRYLNLDVIIIDRIPTSLSAEQNQLEQFLIAALAQEKKFGVEKTIILNNEAADTSRLEVLIPPTVKRLDYSVAVSSVENVEGGRLIRSQRWSARLLLPGARALSAAIAILALLEVVSRALKLDLHNFQPDFAGFKLASPDLDFSPLGDHGPDLLIKPLMDLTSITALLHAAKSFSVQKEFSLLVAVVFLDSAWEGQETHLATILVGACNRVYFTTRERDSKAATSLIKRSLKILQDTAERGPEIVLAWGSPEWDKILHQAINSSRLQDTIVIIGDVPGEVRKSIQPLSP